MQLATGEPWRRWRCGRSTTCSGRSSRTTTCSSHRGSRSGPGVHSLRKTIDSRFDHKEDMAALAAMWQRLEDVWWDGLKEDYFVLPPQIVSRPYEGSMTKAIQYPVEEKCGSKVATTGPGELAPLCKSSSTIASAQDNKDVEPVASIDSLPVPIKGVLVACDTCGKKGDHLTVNCPNKGLASRIEAFVDRSYAADKAAPICQRCKRPATRYGAGFKSLNKDKASILVTNLSEHTRESDLLDLFCSFGLVTRLCLAADDETGFRMKFGIVEFGQIEDAEEAISWLNGYIYDKLALQVEWAIPKTKAVYVPPLCPICMKATANCVRVTNLSEDTRESDHLDLFCPFGLVTRLHLAADEKPGSCKQVGIVEFGQREDAEEAIRWMNRYAYGNLILQVEDPFRPQDVGL